MKESSVVGAHLTPVMTNRGFQHLPRMAGRRDRGWVQVYESSNADEACIWVQAIDDKGTEATIQFNLEAARKLAEQIVWLCENHYQLDDEEEDDAPEQPVCPGFAWIGQPITSCDNCGKPAWDHDYDQRLSKGAPFATDQPWRYVPWDADLIDGWRRKGYITPERAMHLLALGAHNDAPPADADGEQTESYDHRA